MSNSAPLHGSDVGRTLNCPTVNRCAHKVPRNLKRRIANTFRVSVFGRTHFEVAEVNRTVQSTAQIFGTQNATLKCVLVFGRLRSLLIDFAYSYIPQYFLLLLLRLFIGRTLLTGHWYLLTTHQLNVRVKISRNVIIFTAEFKPLISSNTLYVQPKLGN